MEELPPLWSLPPGWWERYCKDRETEAHEALARRKASRGLWFCPHPRRGTKCTKHRVSRL